MKMRGLISPFENTFAFYIAGAEMRLKIKLYVSDFIDQHFHIPSFFLMAKAGYDSSKTKAKLESLY